MCQSTHYYETIPFVIKKTQALTNTRVLQNFQYNSDGNCFSITDFEYNMRNAHGSLWISNIHRKWAYKPSISSPIEIVNDYLNDQYNQGYSFIDQKEL